MAISVGERAPDFSLPATSGKEPVRLASFRGERNVVLLFFPLAWTGVCTQEMCAIRDDYAQFAEWDAEVLGISVDSPFALRAWAREQGFQFPLLSDFNRTAARAYDVYLEDMMGLHGVAKRAAFVIDKSGIVRYSEETPNPGVLPDLAAIRRTLAELAG